MSSDNTMNISTLIPDEESEDSVSLLWLPYVLLSLFLLAMAFSSFFHYHSQNKGKYFHTREVQVQPEKNDTKGTNKYRVTMSRNGKVASINFNILDYTNCLTEEEIPMENIKKHEENILSNKHKSTPTEEKYKENDWKELHDGTCQHNCHVINVAHSGVNKNSAKHSALLASYKNSAITVIADVNEATQGKHIRDGDKEANHTYPPQYNSISHQRKTPKFTSMASRDVYCNEAYDSNCDSEKSLISAHNNKCTEPVNIKTTLKKHHMYYYNDSFESQESATTTKDDLHDKSSFSDDIPSTLLHGKHDIPHNSSSKDSLNKMQFKQKSNAERKGLFKKTKDTIEEITNISSHVPNFVQLKQPDILMHSDHSAITTGQGEMQKSSSDQINSTSHGQNRPQSLDLTKPSDRKAKHKLTNGYTLPNDLLYIQL